MMVLPRSPPMLLTMVMVPSLRARIAGATMLISQWFETMLFCRILVKASSEMPPCGP